MSLKFKYAHSIHGVIRIMSVEKLEVDYNSITNECVGIYQLHASLHS